MDPVKVGKFIFELRKRNKLTQQEFAVLFGVTYQAVSKWENGKSIPDISIIKDICEKFDVSINDVFDIEDRNKKNKYNALIFFFSLFLILSFVFFANNIGSKNFNFKLLESQSDMFTVSGILAYDCAKSSINISKVEYHGEQDTTKYKKIECVLYESGENADFKIGNRVKEEEIIGITISDFLNNISFHIDDYSSLCKKISDGTLFLQINAYDQNNRITSYKIPLEIKENCGC